VCTCIGIVCLLTMFGWHRYVRGDHTVSVLSAERLQRTRQETADERMGERFSLTMELGFRVKTAKILNQEERRRREGEDSGRRGGRRTADGRDGREKGIDLGFRV
jgi:hypothetical protein